MTVPKIEGSFSNDKSTLRKYSKDRSSYVVAPKLVAYPKSEKDIIKIVDYARREKIPITGRGTGSNVCGSAIGKGIIVDFSQMKKILWEKGENVRTQPGIVYDDLNKEVKKRGLFLPYSPGSGSICTVGGNVGTKASGIGGVKYGSTDASLRNVRFVDVKGRVVDTSKPLPPDLEKSIVNLKRKIMNDKIAMRTLKRREHIKTSCGYNIRAFLDYSDPKDIVAHLMSGSVGTLGLFTELEFHLANLPKGKLTCLAFFKNLEDASVAVKYLLGFGPSALEVLESSTLKNIENIPPNSNVILVEFDDGIKRSREHVKRFFEMYATGYKMEVDPEKQKKILEIRRGMLPLAERIENGKTIPFIEDVSIPVDQLAGFVYDMHMLFRKYKIQAVIFGHAGEGNIHIRPVIPEKNWAYIVENMAKDCFNCVFKRGGSITGEHGSGRSRAPYLEKEWGPEIYGYFKEIKKIFDPGNLLNPDVMFNSGPITKDMVY